MVVKAVDDGIVPQLPSARKRKPKAPKQAAQTAAGNGASAVPSNGASAAVAATRYRSTKAKIAIFLQKHIFGGYRTMGREGGQGGQSPPIILTAKRSVFLTYAQ